MRMLRVIDSIEIYTKDAKRKCHFELGELYINMDSVVFVIEGEHKSFFENAINTIRNLKFDSEDMKKEISRYVPSVVKTFEAENSLIMIAKKTKDLVLLRDVLNYYNGQMDAKHVAWVLSSLYNLVCYFDFIKLAHNDISLDTYFISPEFHNGVLLGGWWYNSEFGKKILGVPARTFNLFPSDLHAKKGGDPRVDLDLIKAVGRELLGDFTGTKLLSMKAAPKPMIDWLRWESKGDAVGEYSTWKNEVIMASFGERKFTNMELKPEQIYL